jgi:hypothetical protein
MENIKLTQIFNNELCILQDVVVNPLSVTGLLSLNKKKEVLGRTNRLISLT